MKTRYLLIVAVAALGFVTSPPSHAQGPAHLPPPLITAPKPVVKPPPAVAANNVAKPKIVWCPACRGRKTIGMEAEGNCRSCNGSGKVVSGFTKIETACNFCRGSGKVMNIVQQPCPMCQAKGTLESAVFEQYIGCTNCAGQKVLETEASVTCVTCNGAGKIVKTTSSGGFGSSGSFGSRGGKSGISASSSPQEQPCTFCNATGKVDKRIRKTCPTCYGTGVIPPPPAPDAPPADGQAAPPAEQSKQ